MSDTQSPSTTAEHPPEEVRLAITGMTCASCSARIERKLAKVAGVQSATVNLATEKAQVRFSAPVTVDDIVAEGEKVVVRGHITGTHQGELMGIPATGKRATIQFIDINRIANGKIVERWAAQDDMGFLQQLGLIRAPGSPPA